MPPTLTASNPTTDPISMTALIQRINRALAKKDEQLRKTPPPRGEGFSNQWLDCGEYYVVDTRMNACVGHHVDPEALGRSLGVLREWESVTA